MIDRTDIDRLALFRTLNPAALDVLARDATTRTFAPDSILWRAGARPGGLCIILSGEVRVVRATAGRQHVIHTEGPGGTLGDVPLFHGSNYPATAIASQRTRCLIVSKDTLLAAIRADPGLALALLERLAARVRHLVDRLDRIAARTVHARLALWLLERHARTNGEFTLGKTQLQLAEELGTVREVVVRALRHMRDAGIIQSNARGRYRILDLDRLQAMRQDD